MGLFGSLFQGGSDKGDERSEDWDVKFAWDSSSESQDCPRCGQPMTKRWSFSGWWCGNCHAGLEDVDNDDDDDSEHIDVQTAAQIWASNGKDEDYTFGYSEEELEDAL